MRPVLRGILISGCTLLVVSACGSQAAVSEDSAATNTAAPSEASVTAQPVTASADAPGAAATPPAPATSGWPKQSELERQALSVTTYSASAPSRCALAPPRAGGESGGATVTIYFGCVRPQGADVPAVPARIVRVQSGNDPMSAALRAVLSGPTDGESRAGYLSSFSAASAGVPFRVARLASGMAAVDFDRAILAVNAPRSDPTQNPRRLFVVPMDAHQIVATLGQFSGVRRVAILVGGEPLCRARGEC